jgi:hypothetical protein
MDRQWAPRHVVTKVTCDNSVEVVCHLGFRSYWLCDADAVTKTNHTVDSPVWKLLLAQLQFGKLWTTVDTNRGVITTRVKGLMVHDTNILQLFLDNVEEEDGNPLMIHGGAVLYREGCTWDVVYFRSAMRPPMCMRPILELPPIPASVTRDMLEPHKRKPRVKKTKKKRPQQRRAENYDWSVTIDPPMARPPREEFPGGDTTLQPVEPEAARRQREVEERQAEVDRQWEERLARDKALRAERETREAWARQERAIELQRRKANLRERPGCYFKSSGDAIAYETLRYDGWDD